MDQGRQEGGWRFRGWLLRKFETDGSDGGRMLAHLTYHTCGAKPPTIALLYTLDGRIDTPEMESPRTSIAIHEITVRATRRTVIIVVELGKGNESDL